MSVALPQHNTPVVARQSVPRKLSRELLTWLARRGDQRLVATLLELESTFHDGIETVRCSLEKLDSHSFHEKTPQNEVSTQRPNDCVSVSNESGYAVSIREGTVMDRVEQSISKAIDEIITKAHDLSGLEPALILSALAQAVTEKRWQLGIPIKMREVESEVVTAALKANSGNRSRTAAELGIGRRRLDYRLKARAACKKSAAGRP